MAHNPVSALVREVRGALEAAGDADRAAQQQAYMKSTMPYAGVATPAMRRIAKQAFTAHPLKSAADWQDGVLSLWRDARYREERYVAIGLARVPGYRPFRTPATLTVFDELIITGAWWDYVDEIAINLIGELLDSYPRELRPALLRWTADSDIWRRRSAILAQLKFKQETDLELLVATLEPAMESREFFLRKAIGWALREYSKTDPDFVIEFVTGHRDALSPLSKREAYKVMLKNGTVQAVP